MSVESEEGFEPQVYVFEGFRLVRRGGVADYLEQAHFRHQASGDLATFDWTAKAFKGFEPGRIYRIPVKEGRFHFSLAEFVQPVGDDDARQAMVLADRANRASAASAKQADKLLKADLELDVVLRPLFKAYRECRTWEAQTAFEALVLKAIRKAGISR